MTALLAPLAKNFTIVDGTAPFCENLRRRFPHPNVVHSLFEELPAQEQFDNVALGSRFGAC